MAKVSFELSLFAGVITVMIFGGCRSVTDTDDPLTYDYSKLKGKSVILHTIHDERVYIPKVETYDGQSISGLFISVEKLKVRQINIVNE